VVTLRQHGIKHLRASGRGDLHVHVDVHVPTGLDERQTELLRELATLRDEDHPTVTAKPGAQHGIFSRLKEAFSSR
jgi:molecular chaperone DnaJ